MSKTRKTSILLHFSPTLLKLQKQTELTPFLQLDNGLGPYIERTTKIGFGKKPTLFGRQSTCQTIIKNYT